MPCGVFRCISVDFGVFRCISVFTLTRQYSCSSPSLKSFTQYHVIYVMILPLGITAGRTRILPTIELNSLPLLIKEYCAV